MNTWSGQPESSAWHWTPENCQKLGCVVLLLKCGGAANREQAYQNFIEIKRNFIEEEFNDYLNRLEDFQVSMGGEPLRKTIEEIQGSRKPVTGWKATEGRAIEPVMLPEMEADNAVVNARMTENIRRWNSYYVLVHDESGCAWIDKEFHEGDGLVYSHVENVGLAEAQRHLEQLASMGYDTTDYREGFEAFRDSKPVPVTRYDLFITLLKRGYHALEM